MGTKIQAEFKVSQTSDLSTAGNFHVEEAADTMVGKNNELGTKDIDALDISGRSR